MIFPSGLLEDVDDWLLEVSGFCTWLSAQPQVDVADWSAYLVHSVAYPIHHATWDVEVVALLLALVALLWRFWSQLLVGAP